MEVLQMAEKYGIDTRFLVRAVHLAEQYGQMVEERGLLRDILNGKQIFTREMAITELSGGKNMDSERVQTSNISNPTERIGLKLADGYVEKRNRQIRREVEENIGSVEDLDEMIDVVEVAMKERMDSRDRAIFQRVYIRHRTFHELKAAYRGRLDNKQICRAKENAIIAIAEELESRESMKCDAGPEAEGGG